MGDEDDDSEGNQTDNGSYVSYVGGLAREEVDESEPDDAQA